MKIPYPEFAMILRKYAWSLSFFFSRSLASIKDLKRFPKIGCTFSFPRREI